MRSSADHRRRDGHGLRGGRASRAARLAVAVAAGCLALSAGAFGAAPKATVVTDSATDGKGLDITRVSVGMASDGRLRLSVSLAKDWTAADLLAKDGQSPGSVCVRLWAKTKPGATLPDYLACVWSPGGTRLKGTVMRTKAGADPAPAGAARITRSSARTVTLAFAPAKIGSPASVRFIAEATRPNCPRLSCTDTAPAAPKTATAKLR